MIEVTKPKADELDIRRNLYQPEGQTLALLKHKPTGERGYDKLIDVTAGWRFEGRTGQPGTLHIAEMNDVTLDMLQKARAFSISGTVYILQDTDDATTKPANDTALIWKYKVTPNGETFTDEG